MSIAPLPNARLQYADINGAPLIGGSVHYYVPGTLAPKPTFRDYKQTIPNTNPVILDGQGQAAVWGLGSYRQVVRDRFGDLVWDDVTTAIGTSFDNVASGLDPILVALEQSGYLGTGQTFDITTTVSGATIDVGFNVRAAWLLPLFRNGVLQVAGADYTVDGSSLVTVTDAYTSGERFTGYDAGAKFGIGLAPGETSIELHGGRGFLPGNTPTDDTLAILAAAASGLVIVGDPNKRYGLSSQLRSSSFPGTPRMRSVKLVNLAPTTVPKPLFFSAGPGPILDRCGIDLGGDGDNGTLNTAGGLWLDSLTTPYLITDFEVTGRGRGSGIRINNCPNGGDVVRPYCHDLVWGSGNNAFTSDGDDQLIGLWVTDSANPRIDKPRVENVLGRWLGQTTPINQNTRGICLGGGWGMVLTEPYVSDVDEGIDFTGDETPQGWRIVGGLAQYCRKFGWKFAVSADNGEILGARAWRCTLEGFYFQGSNQTLPDPTANVHNIIATDCVAEETGYNVSSYYPGYTTAGFRCDAGSSDGSYPRRVLIVRPRTLGGTAMKFGVLDNSTTLGDDRNRLIDASGLRDASQAAVSGILDSYSLLGAVDQPVASGAPTLLSFSVAQDDRMVLLGSPPVATTAVTLIRSGRVRISAFPTFAQNNTGNRTVRIKRNGTGADATIAGAYDTRSATQNTATSLQAFADGIDVVAGDVLRVEVLQDSGATLNVIGGNDLLKIVYDGERYS